MEAIPVRYRLASAPTQPAFELEVDQYLVRGWVLIGGPIKVNDRWFQALIMPNDDNLPIAVHYDSEKAWKAY